MDKHVFLITDNIVIDKNLYSFEYTPELFSEYKQKYSIKSYECISDLNISETPLQYEKIVTSVFYDLNIKKAQIVDISLGEIKLTGYSSEKNSLNTTSLKVPISQALLIESFLSLLPNRIKLANNLLNFILNKDLTQSGSPNLNSHLLSTLLCLAKNYLSDDPVVVLSDLVSVIDLKNFIDLAYNNIGLNNDIYLYAKSDCYFYSHKLSDSISKKSVKYINMPLGKKTNGFIETPLAEEPLSAGIKIYEVKESFKLFNSGKKLVFQTAIFDFVVIDTNDYSHSKKNK